MATTFAERFAAKPKPPAAAVALGLGEPFRTDRGWKWVGRCPACAEDGKDTSAEHLIIYEDGRFGCAANKGEAGAEHRSLMAKLCQSLRGSGGKYEAPEFVRPDMTAEREAIKAAALVLFAAIQEEFSGDLSDLGESAEINTDPRWQFGQFCDLYQPGDLIWTGNRKDSAPITIDKKTKEVRETPPFLLFTNHLFTAGDEAARDRMFALSRRHPIDLGRGNSWKPGSQQRLQSNLEAVRFTCLEHDDVDKPAQIALFRYAQTVLGWDLRMVVDSTNKSYHGLFDVSHLSPSTVKEPTVKEHIELLTNMGADPMSLNEAACRVPGFIRQRVKPKEGKPEKPFGGLQRIVWLKP
jgi:hypothetical protein